MKNLKKIVLSMISTILKFTLVIENVTLGQKGTKVTYEPISENQISLVPLVSSGFEFENIISGLKKFNH